MQVVVSLKINDLPASHTKGPLSCEVEWVPAFQIVKD